jgi:hypothetical protein
MLPFMPPPMQAPMGAMPPGPMDDEMPMTFGADPAKIIDLILGSEPDWKIKPPPGWKQPKRPKPEAIWAEAMQEEGRNQRRVNRMMETVARLRFERSGVFPADAYARAVGDQDEWKSSALVDDYNMLCAIVASMSESWHKRTLNREHRLKAQTLEDAARYFREEEIYRWANTGDMDLPLAEIKIAACYGMVIARTLCDLDDPDYPFDDALVDPASCYVIPGGVAGPKRVYRMMRMTQSEAFETWGEPRKRDRDRFQNSTGRDEDTKIITVCEYADTWYRAAVLQDGIELLPVTEHRYYSVPFVVQGGPAGEPLFTDTARASADEPNRLGGGWWRSGPMDDWGMEHKLTSSITAQQERHDQLEAMMAWIVTSLRDSTDPALIIKRDPLSLGTPMPEIDRRRGKRNEIGLGDDVLPVPTSMNPRDLQTFTDYVQQDSMTGRIPLGMYGQQPGSNITGNSMSTAAESGMDHITPWVKAMETFQTRKIEQKLRFWRLKGHLTRFWQGYEQPFMIPTRPGVGKDVASELTPDLIDEIGPRVIVTKTRLRMQDLVMYANIGPALQQMGYPARRMFEKMGEEDFDRLREEWQEEQEWLTVMTDETMVKMVKIPLRLKSWADEAETPEERAMFMALLDQYMMTLTPPPQPALPPGGMPPSAGMPPPGGGMPTGAPPLPGAVAGNTLNQPALGAPPGAAGAPVGRPPIY